MADYRLDCCGGFPSCVCAKKRADAERAAAARKRAEATDSTWRGEAPDHSYAVKFECNKCAAVTNEPEKHFEWHNRAAGATLTSTGQDTNSSYSYNIQENSPWNFDPTYSE